MGRFAPCYASSTVDNLLSAWARQAGSQVAVPPPPIPPSAGDDRDDQAGRKPEAEHHSLPQAETTIEAPKITDSIQCFRSTMV